MVMAAVVYSSGFRCPYEVQGKHAIHIAQPNGGFLCLAEGQ